MEATLPDNEQERLTALHDHNILDTAPEQEFDDLVRLAASLCGVPIAAVSLIDEHRQWFKAMLGLPTSETPRADAFCAHTILQPGVFVVQDAQADPRFADNPLVTGDPNIRFYAGAPLLTEEGLALGSLCIIDRVPRQFTPEQGELLRLLARQVAGHLKAARRFAERELLLAEKERMAAERERVEADRLRLAAIVETCDDAVYGRTLDGIITSWNAGAQRLYGYSAAEMIGRDISLLVPPDRLDEMDHIAAGIRRGERVLPLETVRLTKAGGRVDVSLHVSLITDANGRVAGASMIARDITERKRSETALAESGAELQESEERLKRLTDAAFEGIAISHDGVLEDVNPAFAQMFGYGEPAEMAGTSAVQLCAPESRAFVIQKIGSGDERPYEAVLQRRDGTTFQAELRARMIQRNGLPARVTAVRDISERKEMERALSESQAFTQAVADNSASLIYVFDLDTRSNIYANRGLAEFWGYTPGEIRALGSELVPRTFHPDDVPFLRAHGSDFAALPDGEVMEFETRCRHADGSWRWVWHREVVFKRHSDGRPRQVLGNAQDITERKQAEDALRLSQERLTEAQRVARLGSWEYDIVSGRITWSDELFRLFGLEPADAAPGYEAAVALYHPEDAPVLDALVARAAQEGIGYSLDLRGAPDQEGLCRWYHTVGTAVTDESGRIIRLSGTLADIHDRKMAEERFRVLFDESSDAHLLLGKEGIIDCNNATLALLGCEDKSQVLSLHPAVMSPEFQPDGRRSCEKRVEMDALAYERGFHRFEWVQRKTNGEEFPVEVSLTPVTLSGRSVLLSVLHDLTERKHAEEQIKDHAVILEFQKLELEKANAELEALATTDGLTGLKNHRAFQERLAEEASRASRYGLPLSLILLDVDGFKRYNDTHGHPAGDAVLKTVAQVLQNCARDTDLVARYGGEEFVVVLPQTDSEGAMIFAERLRASVESYPWLPQNVTASFGVASLHLGEEGGTDLIARADRALYRSKAEGRNRVTYGAAGACLPGILTT